MSKFKQAILDAIREMTLLDDAFMTKVFENDIKRAQFLLRIILTDDTIKVKEVTTQNRIKNLQGRDLQLDILAQKANGTLFNVEVQNENSGAIPRRARYHMSVLDGISLPKGQYFDKLPDNYVIFITKHDVLHGKLPIYHIHRTIDETGKSFADGSHIIYVNCEIQDETPLGRLMHDFCCKNPDDMHYQELAEKTRYLKEEQGGEQVMGDVIEKLMAEVRAEAIAEEQAKAATKISKVKAKAAKAEAKAAKTERTTIAKKMLANNESMEKVMLYSSLSLAEIRALAKKMSA